MPFEDLGELFAEGGAGPIGAGVMTGMPEAYEAYMGPATQPVQPTMMERISSAFREYGVPLLESGALATLTGTMIGPEHPMGRLGLAAGRGLQARQLGEQYRRLLSSMLGGAEGEARPFVEGPARRGIMELGLTPEQVSQFYGTVLTEAEKARKAPFEEMLMLAQAEKFTAGAMQDFATAYKLAGEIGAVGEDRVMKALEFMRKVRETEAKTALEEAQAVATRGKEVREAEAVTPERRAEEHKRKLEVTAAAHPPREIPAPTVVSGVMAPGGVPATAVIPRGGAPAYLPAAPTAVTPEQVRQNRKFAIQRAAPLMIPELERAIAAQPGGPAKLKLQDLVESMRSIGTGEIDPSVVEARLAKTPELLNLYNRLADVYLQGLQGGISETLIGAAMRAEITRGPGAAAPVGPAAPATPGAAVGGLTTRQSELVSRIPPEKLKEIVGRARKEKLTDTQIEALLVEAAKPAAPAKPPVQAEKSPSLQRYREFLREGAGGRSIRQRLEEMRQRRTERGE